MWNQFENKFKVQFLCAKEDVINLKHDDIMQSSKCSAVGKLWWLVLQLNVDRDDEVSDYIGLFLHSSTGDPKVVVCETYRLVAKCCSNNIEEAFDATNPSVFHLPDRDEDSCCWGIDLVRISTLESDASKFCCDGQFLFEVHVTILSIDDVPIPQPSIIMFRENVDCSVSKRTRATTISKLAGSNSDEVVVISKCGVEFTCHAHILSTNFVFRQVYLAEQDQMDSESVRRVVLRDMSVDVVRVVLSHIYYGSLKFDVLIAGDVLHAAETHDLPLLKRECEVVMSHNLGISNFLDYLMVAELTSSKILKSACLSFWPEHGTDIMQTGDWDKFMDSKDAKNKILCRNLYEQMFDVLQNIEKK